MTWVFFCGDRPGLKRSRSSKSRVELLSYATTRKTSFSTQQMYTVSELFLFLQNLIESASSSGWLRCDHSKNRIFFTVSLKKFGHEKSERNISVRRPLSNLVTSNTISETKIDDTASYVVINENSNFSWLPKRVRDFPGKLVPSSLLLAKKLRSLVLFNALFKV